MPDLGTRLDDLGRAATTGLRPLGLDDVRERAARQQRVRAGALAAVGAVVLVAAGVGATALRSDGDRANVIVAPTATAAPSTSALPSEPATPAPSATVSEASRSQERPQRQVALPMATTRTLTGRNTGPEGTAGARYRWGAEEVTFGPTSLPDDNETNTNAMVVDFESVWMAMDGGVLEVDARTLQPLRFFDTGPVLAMATNGYGGLHAATRLPNGGLGLVSWGEEPGPPQVQELVLDPSPGAADTVTGYKSLAAFGEAAYLTRTYSDRPSELWRIFPGAGQSTTRLLTTGEIGTRLVVSRLSNDGVEELWVGGTDGVLRHIHDDGRVTSVTLSDRILDVDASRADRVWVTTDAAGRTELVAVDQETDKVVVRHESMSAVFLDAAAEQRLWLSFGSDDFEGVLLEARSWDGSKVLSETNLPVGGVKYINDFEGRLYGRGGPRVLVRVSAVPG